MRLKSIMKSGGLAALAVGLAALSVPSAASAEPGDRGSRSEGRGQGSGGGGEGRWQGGGGGEGRGGNYRQAPQAQQQPQAQRQAQPQAQAQPTPRNWGGDRNGAEAGRGWGGPRPEGQQRSRDMSGGRPQPQAQVPVQQAPVVRQQAPQNRDYADRTRNGTYTQRQQGWDGRQWNGQNTRDGRNAQYQPRYDGNRDGNRYDGNRSGNWDRDRQGGNWDRNRQGGNWSRDWRRDNRYNWQSWRSSNRDVFRLGRYNPPYRDYSYRRLSIGFYLDTMFFGSSYWLGDPYAYRLPPAYGPYRWVRYYDDALLVNIYDGEVVDVIYDVFW